MRSALRAAMLAVLVCTGFGCGPRAVHPFEFRIPDGWTRLSDAAVAEDRRAAIDAGTVDAALAARAASSTHGVRAVNPASAGSFRENMNALVIAGTMTYDKDVVGRISTQLSGVLAKAIDNAPVEVADARIVLIRGVACANFTYDFALRGVPVRETVYLLPGDAETANVTFSADRASFDAHRAIYESSVEATQGIVAPVSATSYLSWVIPAIVGVAGAQVLFLRRRSQRKARTG